MFHCHRDPLPSPVSTPSPSISRVPNSLTRSESWEGERLSVEELSLFFLPLGCLEGRGFILLCALSSGMVGNSLASPFLHYDSAARFAFSIPYPGKYTPDRVLQRANFLHRVLYNEIQGIRKSKLCTKKWGVRSTAQTYSLSEEESRSWEACKEALGPFHFSAEEQDKILGKAFGHVHSPYWSEEREKEVPKFEAVTAKLNYLRGLSLSDDDLCKLLKKFPEVLGCDLEQEMKNNVQVLEKDWGIEGNSLKKLLLRNPKVLGYNVDCKGDCMAKCTRCWVRF